MPKGVYTRTVQQNINNSKSHTGKRPANYKPEKHTFEDRICACGCEKLFRYALSSNKKFIHSHNLKHPSKEVLEKQLVKKTGKNSPRYKPQNHDKETRLCACECKTPFECAISSLKRYISGHNGSNKTERIIEKLKTSFSGKNNPNWNGGITPLNNQIRHCYEYRQWRSDVFTRDNFTCQYCNAVSGYLNAHHIKPFSTILKENNITIFEQALNCAELWNINNGTTICKNCHTENRKNLHNYHE